MKRVLVLAAIFVFFAYEVEAAPDAPSFEVFKLESSMFDRELSISQTAQELNTNSASRYGIESATKINFLGNPKTLIRARVEATLLEENEAAFPVAPIPETLSPQNNSENLKAKTDWYIGGVRIWTGDLKNQKQSSEKKWQGLSYSESLAPLRMSFPVFTYPLGPVILQVDAGVNLEGMIQAGIIPELSFPLRDSALKARLQAKVIAGGFVEGYAKLLMVRAGVGGRLNLIDGSAGVQATLFFNGDKVKFEKLGKIVLFNGRVYGFVDSSLVVGKWRRWFSYNFFDWDGKCYAFGADECRN